jgi:hypothetical protein
MKRKHLVIAVIVIQTLIIISLYAYGFIHKIDAENTRSRAVLIHERLKATQQQLEKVEAELENCKKKNPEP